MKYFMQYIEGTLFDWQFGDLMPNTCEAGDIRIRYTVQDPKDISILGQLKATTSTRSDNNIREGHRNQQHEHNIIEPIETNNGGRIGLVHYGFHSAQDMIITEDQDSLVKAAIWRFMFLLWSFGIIRFTDVGSYLFRYCGSGGGGGSSDGGRSSDSSSFDFTMAGIPTQVASTLSIWCFLCGSSWIWFWGVGRQQVDGMLLCIAAFVFSIFVHWFPPPLQTKANKKRKME